MEKAKMSITNHFSEHSQRTMPQTNITGQFESFYLIQFGRERKTLMLIKNNQELSCSRTRASRFLRELLMPSYLPNLLPMRAKVTNIIHNNLGQTRTSVTSDRTCFLFKPDLNGIKYT